MDKFEQWLWLEVFFVWATIISSCFYCFLSKMIRPSITETSTLLPRLGYGDFIDTNMLMIDLVNAILVPGLVALMMAFVNTN